MPCRCDYPSEVYAEEYRKLYRMHSELRTIFIATGFKWEPMKEEKELYEYDIHTKTDDMCKFLNSLSKENKEKCSEEIREWLAKHNAADAVRESASARWKQQENEQRSANAALMTPAERKLFGL
jgi:hypothetical protein